MNNKESTNRPFSFDRRFGDDFPYDQIQAAHRAVSWRRAADLSTQQTVLV